MNDKKAMHMERSIKIACIGDSITAGYGLNSPQQESYPAILQSMLGKGFDVRNFGVSGSTVSRGILSHYGMTDKCLEALDFCPDLAIIELGANDMLYIEGHEQNFIRDYEILLDAVKEGSPEVKIFMTLLTPIKDIDALRIENGRKRYDQIQDLLRLFADNHSLPLIDIWSPLKSALDLRPSILPDGVHPDAEGAFIIAETDMRFFLEHGFFNEI